MRKFLLFFTITLLSLVLTGCTFPFTKAQKSALQVSSAPKATVFLDGKHVGQTPFFDDKLKPGEYTLKLVPEDSTGQLNSWETKIKLTPLVLTVVNRDIGPSDADSSGEILSLEPLSTKTKSALAVVSLPESVIVKLDNQPKGFTPLSLDDISTGEHTITLTTPGYQDKTLKVKINPGHKLTILAQLAKSALVDSQPEPDAAPTPEPSSSPQASTSPKPSSSPGEIASASASAKSKPYVEILDNPVGYLRVRAEPSTSSDEVARAVPGQRLPYAGEEKLGWYQVTYATGKDGWVTRGASGEYAKLVQ